MALNFRFLIGDEGSYDDIDDFIGADGDAFYSALARDPFTSQSGTIDELRSIDTLMKILENPRGYLNRYSTAKKLAVAESSREAQAAYRDFLNAGVSNAREKASKVFDETLKARQNVINLKYDSNFLKEARKSVQFGVQSKYR
jgi:hypothetical protein